MSLLTYNGIALNLVKVHEWSRQFVYSGPNYAYTRHRLVVRAVFNPGTQTGTLAGLPAAPFITTANTLVAGPLGPPILPVPPPLPAAPVGGGLPVVVGPVVLQQVGLGGGVPAGGGVPGVPGIPAVTSEVAVRHDLAQPRRQLVYSVAGAPVLISPLLGYTTDVTNGPRPFYFNVVDIKGPRTFVVDYGIETDVNECVVRATPEHFILSHTWSMDHVLDQDFFTKRVINGKVVFRADVLNNSVFNRDDFRRLLAHPIPSNMKRVQVHVHAEEDGYTYSYQIIDQELPLNLSDPNVTRFEGLHTVEVMSNNQEKVAADLAFSLAVREADVLSRARGSPLGVPDPTNLAAEGAANWLLIGAHLAKGFYDSLPTSRHHVICRAWGSRNATRAGLEAFCSSVITARLGAFQANLRTVGGFHTRTTHDIAGKFVEMEESLDAGPLATGAAGLVAFFTGSSPFGTNDDTATLIVTAAGRAAATPPDDGISRGTYLEDAIGGALLGPCQSAIRNPTSAARQPFPPLTV